MTDKQAKYMRLFRKGHHLSINDVSKRVREPVGVVSQMVGEMSESGYLFRLGGGNPYDQPYMASQIGIGAWEDRRIIHPKYLVQNILVPIIVGVLSAIVTTYIQTII